MRRLKLKWESNCNTHSLTQSPVSHLTHHSPISQHTFILNRPLTTSISKVVTICRIKPRARRGMGERGGIFSCRVGSVRNMVRSKICANRGNRTRHSDHAQANPNFLHFSPEFPRNKFENFFKNSYRTIVLTNSSKEVPKFFIKGENYKKTTEKLFSFLIFR